MDRPSGRRTPCRRLSTPGPAGCISPPPPGTARCTSPPTARAASARSTSGGAGGVGEKFQPAENLGPTVNGPGWLNLEAFVTPEEDLLLLGSVGRPEAPGAGDLYLSVRRQGEWTAPEPLGLGINTAAREYSPRVSNDGQWLLFASERGFPIEPRTRPIRYRELVERLRGVDNGLGNLYRIRLRAVLDDLERRLSAEPDALSRCDRRAPRERGPAPPARSGRRLPPCERAARAGCAR